MNKESKKEVKIPVNGSLGILAHGDIGLKAWRRVRDEAKEKDQENKKSEENIKGGENE